MQLVAALNSNITTKSRNAEILSEEFNVQSNLMPRKSDQDLPMQSTQNFESLGSQDYALGSEERMASKQERSNDNLYTQSSDHNF